MNDYINELETTIEMNNVDTELLLDYITYLELKFMGKLVNGRLPFFDDEMVEPEYVGE
jgi:hypothetical protein